MEFRTKVELPLKGPEIHHADQLMMWGSCFSEHIGNLLSENKFTCDLSECYTIRYPSLLPSNDCWMAYRIRNKICIRSKDNGTA